jgi:hypothetical protein
MAVCLVESEINELADEATPDEISELQRQYNA